MTISRGMGTAGIVAVPIPPHGEAGQVLTKSSTANYDTEWAEGGGAGGIATVIGGTNINVDDTDPENPIVNLDQAVLDTSVNGVTLSDDGVATDYLNETGLYSTPPDATVSNDTYCIYLWGDADTTGSFRVCYDEDNQVLFSERRKANGTWVDSGYKTIPHSLWLGLGLKVGASWRYILTEAPTGPESTSLEDNALVPHIEILDETGTYDKQVHTPTLDFSNEYDVFPEPVDSDRVGLVLGQVFSLPIRFIASQLTMWSGNTSSTDEILWLRIYLGTNNTGTLIFEREVGPDELSSNTYFTLETQGLGADANQLSFLEISTTGTSPLSLGQDVDGELVLNFNLQHIKEELIMTENMMLDSDLNTMFDSDLNPMYRKYFDNYNRVYS